MEVGDLVKITDTRPTDIYSFEPKWQPLMDAYLGKIGRITKANVRNFLVGVDEHEEWWYSPRWLTKVFLETSDSVKVGDLVKVVDVKPHDVAGGPCWVLSMDKYLGKIGKVYNISKGNYGIVFPDDEFTWYYHPKWVRKIVLDDKANSKSLKTNKQLLLI